jgi:hypothetical protein
MSQAAALRFPFLRRTRSVQPERREAMRLATRNDWRWPSDIELAGVFDAMVEPYDENLPLPSFEEARDA